jgi:hypothetical protein
MVGLTAAAYGYATAVWVMPVVLLLSVPVLWSAGRFAPHTTVDPGPAQTGK